jgi:hypothetical protein
MCWPRRPQPARCARDGARLSTFGVRARHLVPRPIRRAASHALAERRATAIERELERLAADSRPLVLGPWLGEVGFELLYWVPFVRWFAATYAIPAERLIVVTRGGAAAWYRPFAGRAVDALSMMSPDDYRRKNLERSERTGEQKQLSVGALDDEMLAHVRRVSEPAFAVLHPSLMYRLFAPFWWGHEPMSWVQRFTRYETLEAPPRPAGLPDTYTAVKFYFNDCFTPGAATRAFVERTLGLLLEHGPVVSLTSGSALDEHIVYDSPNRAVHAIDDRLSPETNLSVQSAVIAHARRFVGSYGGFAYLAPSYGIPTDTYYTKPDGFAPSHLQLAQAVLAAGDMCRLNARVVD